MRLRLPRPRDAAPDPLLDTAAPIDLAAVPLPDLKAEGFRRGYELLPLDAFADLEGREDIVSAAEARGHDFAPLVQTLGGLARELQPAADLVSDLAADNARLRRTLAEHAADFTLVAESLLLAEFPECAS